MSQHRDLSPYGYDVIRRLGQNVQGGRVTYLARSLEDETLVVVKTFSFAREDADWAGFKGHQREIELLQTLDHPAIPNVLDAIELDDGFALVQQFIDAPTLQQTRTWSFDEVYDITQQLLDILVVLQQKQPPIIHRDIKPQNILRAKDGTVYLIDFGLARVASGDGSSTLAAGTPGFMAPEQFFNSGVSVRTDLYGLGATIFALLMGIAEDRMNQYVNTSFELKWSGLDANIPDWFVDWAIQLTAPEQQARYADAQGALDALYAAKTDAQRKLPVVVLDEASSVTHPQQASQAKQQASSSLLGRAVLLFGVLSVLAILGTIVWYSLILKSPPQQEHALAMTLYKKRLNSMLNKRHPVLRCGRDEHVVLKPSWIEYKGPLTVSTQAGCTLKLHGPFVLKSLSTKDSKVTIEQVTVEGYAGIAGGTFVMNGGRIKSMNVTAGAVRTKNVDIEHLSVSGGRVIVESGKVSKVNTGQATEALSLRETSTKSIYAGAGKVEAIKVTGLDSAMAVNGGTLNLFFLTVRDVHVDKKSRLHLKDIKLSQMHVSGSVIATGSSIVSLPKSSPRISVSKQGIARLDDISSQIPIWVGVSESGILMLNGARLSLSNAVINGGVIMRDTQISGRAMIAGPMVYHPKKDETMAQAEAALRQKMNLVADETQQRQNQKKNKKRQLAKLESRLFFMMEGCFRKSTKNGDFYPKFRVTPDGRASLLFIDDHLKACFTKKLKTLELPKGFAGTVRGHIYVQVTNGSVQVMQRYLRLY